MQYVCGQMSRAALYKEPVSRLPAAASCLGRHAHPAGRSPNSSSLFLPLAAVVAVAQGLSPAGLFGGSMLFESTRLASGKVITKQKLQYPVRILEFLVGAGGFEPPKLKSSRFTVCPHWPLGNTPISYLQSSLTACIFYHLKWHLSTTFSTDFLFFCHSLFSCVLPQ